LGASSQPSAIILAAVVADFREGSDDRFYKFDLA
jgi:hypothetical protein